MRGFCPWDNWASISGLCEVDPVPATPKFVTLV